MALTNRLAALRKANNLTQEFVAEKMGVSRQAVSRWETGENKPTMEKLETLSKLYGVPLSQLLDAGETFTPEPQPERFRKPEPVTDPTPEAIPQETRKHIRWLPWALTIGFAALSLVLALTLLHTSKQNVEPVKKDSIPMNELPTDVVAPVEETFVFNVW